MDRRVLWVWLSCHYGEGSYLYKKLYDTFGSIEKIYDTDDADVDGISWLFPAFKKRLLDKNLHKATEIVEWCEKYNVKILTPSDDEYPRAFFELDDYPAVLYCYGKLPDFNSNLCVTVVGTRKMSVYGKESAFNLGYGLTRAGALVVSGMARGIDCTAQKGALYAGGTTVAFLGCGINVVYPKENFELMLKIMRVGAVITESAPFTPPNAINFPKRNRLMSAISSATVVVEAGRNSGSLITARISRKLGRKVFAYPSSVNHYFSEGTNDLLFDEEAKLVTCALDVIEPYLGKYKLNTTASKERPVFNGIKREPEVNFMPEGFWAEDRKLDKLKNKHKDKGDKKSKKEKKAKKEAKQAEPLRSIDLSSLNENEKIVYNAFKDGERMTVDALLDSCPTLNFGTISAVLVTLQIKGFIADVPGGFYIKK